MAFVKGNPGKPKGAKNRRTLHLEETAARLNVDPFEVLLMFAGNLWKELGYESECYFSEKSEGDGSTIKMGYVISPETRMKAAADACRYLYIPKKSVDVTSDGNALTTIEVKLLQKTIEKK